MTTASLATPATSDRSSTLRLVRTGAELIIHLIEQQGVSTVAGIPGGPILPLYEALSRSATLRHVLARHEQAAGFIAQGMARLTGKPAVCLVSSGPGVTNIITALADAKLDSVPLVCISGQVTRALIGTDAFQEVPSVDIARPITKASFFVRHASELWHVIPEAFKIAQSGRPGPVLVDVPKDVQQEIVADPADPVRYERAAEMFLTAARPVLYIGGGVVKARAQQRLRVLAERLDTPVVSTLMALGVMTPGHPLNCGMLGMHGARYTNHIVDECDLLIAIGARFDDRATGDAQRFAAAAQIIHIDIDSRELGKIKRPQLSIQADASMAIESLLVRLRTLVRGEWRARVEELRQLFPLRMPGADDIGSPYGLIKAAAAVLPRDVIVTTDVGQHQMWVAQSFPVHRPERFLTSGGLGTMGFGLPVAIGAALAEPTATTVCFTGDGSLLMNIQELATLADLNLNVKIILFDNAALGLVRQQQDLFYRGRFMASRYDKPSQFVDIARAFGIPAYDLQDNITKHAILADALCAPGPALIRVPIAQEQQVLPMVAPGSANTEALDHPA